MPSPSIEKLQDEITELKQQLAREISHREAMVKAIKSGENLYHVYGEYEGKAWDKYVTGTSKLNALERAVSEKAFENGGLQYFEVDRKALPSPPPTRQVA